MARHQDRLEIDAAAPVRFTEPCVDLSYRIAVIFLAIDRMTKYAISGVDADSNDL